jgi:DNA primase
LSGRVPEHVIQQIVRATDLVRLIGRHCVLKPKGKSYWGCCPFHHEKTPSFKVDPDKGLYYCFGCHETGNVFSFLEKVEGLGFREALERLAQDAGVDLAAWRGEEGPDRDEIERLRDLCELAATYYAKCLEKSPSAEHARHYLEGRRISGESLERWRLGYAPDGWEHFYRFARGRGTPEEALVAAGLVKQRESGEGCYDAFRNRIMFPVSDRSGRVIGFGARALSDEDQPKYLNSAEGPLFHKGSCFYGLHEAAGAIRAGGKAVVMEGYTDVIMAHQFGLENVIAVLGTALTEHHARTLRHACDTVVLVFDDDEAGRQSAMRSVEVLLREDLEVRVARLADGLDPCDFLLERGADQMRSRLEEAEDFLEFRLRCARQVHDFGTRAGRSRAFDELAELALDMPNEARRDMVIRQIAGALAVTERSAWAYIERALAQRRGRRAGPAAEAQPGRAEAPRGPERALALELLVVLLEEPSLQVRACKELETDALAACVETDGLVRLLAACRSRGPVSAAEFLAAAGDRELASAVTEGLAREEVRRKIPDALSPEQRYARWVQHAHELHLRQVTETHLAMSNPPAPRTGEPDASGGVPDADEMFRRYHELRREEDRKKSRINPRKASR